MIDLQTIGVLMTGVSVTAAAIYYIFTLRINMKSQQQNVETRQAQLFMGIYHELMSPTYSDMEHDLMDIKMDNMEDFENMYRNKNHYRAVNSQGLVLEGIGVLVKENLIDVRLPSLLISSSIISYWNKFGPMIKEARNQYNSPRMMIEVEGLYDRVCKYAVDHPELLISTESLLYNEPSH
jgi:hypothetical protein